MPDYASSATLTKIGKKCSFSQIMPKKVLAQSRKAYKQGLQWDSNFQTNYPQNFHCIAAHIKFQIFGLF